MKKIRLSKLSRKQILPLALAAAFLMVLLSAGGFAFAASQEENDSFCASCHTQPESTYYQRSTASAAVDLASFHRQKETRCIDCHSGIGLVGRVSAEMMGAQNAFKWYTGSATQPAPLVYPIGDNNCLKCHADVLKEGQDNAPRTVNFGPKGHYHTYLAKWKEADSNAAACTACHGGHELEGSARNAWVIPAAANPACEACHALMGSN